MDSESDSMMAPGLCTPARPAMRFESHFKSYFGNVKAFNLKKFKIIAEPVAAMAGGGPKAELRQEANSFGRA